MADTEVCSCASTTVVRIHSPGSYCGDTQFERLADALGKSVADVLSAMLDALREEPAPAPVVRSDRIELAAQVFCDSSRNGQRWVDLSEPFRDLYRRRVRALAEAGLLVDAPAQQPAGEPEPFWLKDVAGDEVGVNSLPGQARISLSVDDIMWLDPDEADQLADALKAHAAARRADANGSADV